MRPQGKGEYPPGAGEERPAESPGCGGVETLLQWALLRSEILLGSFSSRARLRFERGLLRDEGRAGVLGLYCETVFVAFGS